MHVELPEGWEILPNEADGRPYYVNQETGASQWEARTAASAQSTFSLTRCNGHK